MALTQRDNSRRTDAPRKSAPTIAPLPPEEQKKTGVRVRALRILLQQAEGNIPALALAVGLGTQRVRDALDGILPLGPEMAAHIEHTCHLPGAWLDHPETKLPARAKTRIAKALNGDDLDDDDYEEEGQTPSASVAPAQSTAVNTLSVPASEAVSAVPAKSEESAGLRVVKQTPVITVRRRRTSHAEELAPVAPTRLVEVPASTTVVAPAAPVGAEPAQQVRRGRKAGVKSVEAALEETRRSWLTHVTTPKGTKSQLCRLLQAPDSFVAHLLSGRRTFTDKIAEKIELVMGLPEGTIDGWTPDSAAIPVMPVSAMPVSAAAADIAKAVATMASLVVPAATSAVAPEPQAEAPAPASAPASTKPAAPVAKEKTAKTSSVQPTAPAAKAKPVKEPAAAQPAAPVTAPEAHQAEAPAEKEAQASAPAIPVEVPAFLAVAPVAEPPRALVASKSKLDASLQAALKSMLTRVIEEGKLNNQGAVRLLQELALLVD